MTSKTHQGLQPGLDARSTAWTRRPETVSNDSFWYPTEQLHQSGGVRFGSTSGQPHSPSATATVTTPFSLSQANSVPQLLLAVAK